ncbi:hypothetical protein [Frankia tisae]|uniref:hypothetical protein n=1 Tax=Frankia tisae TaxID=2950104 RepID=UPI0021C0372F|nr:hypothetical protein [Frankia tisae]
MGRANLTRDQSIALLGLVVAIIGTLLTYLAFRSQGSDSSGAAELPKSSISRLTEPQESIAATPSPVRTRDPKVGFGIYHSGRMVLHHGTQVDLDAPQDDAQWRASLALYPRKDITFDNYSRGFLITALLSSTGVYDAGQDAPFEYRTCKYGPDYAEEISSKATREGRVICALTNENRLVAMRLVSVVKDEPDPTLTFDVTTFKLDTD